MWRHFLFDIEGVICDDMDNANLKEMAVKLLERLKREGKRVSLVSNVSRKSRRFVFETLRLKGLPIELEEVFTAGYVAAKYVRDLGFKRCFVISEGGLREDLLELGLEPVDDESAEVVVIGTDRGLTYQRLNYAMRLAIKGRKLVCAGASPIFKGSYLGDAGYFMGESSIAEAIKHATKKEVEYVGKPHPRIFLEALNGEEPSNAVMIGDKVIPDVMGAKGLGMSTVLVGGERALGVKPDLVVSGLRELYEYLYP